MPLARARCPECSEPLADPPHIGIPMQCYACRRPCMLQFAADGQPVDFDASFSPPKMLMWIAAARRQMANGTPGLAVGFCPSCTSPLTISSKEAVNLPCPHCKKPVTGPAETVLVDQWVEPFTRVEGGGLSMEYRLAWVEDTTAITAGCAMCGAPTAADDASQRCRRCGSVTWVQRSGTRMQLGIRVSGTRQDRPHNALVSLAQGEAMLRGDSMTHASASSGSSLLGVTGIGCAVAVGLTVLLGIGIAILAVLLK